MTNGQNQQQNEQRVKITVENTVKLDPQNPIPIQYGNTSFYVASNKKYIPFLGPKDDMPRVLLETRLLSTTQNSCISTIAQSVIGQGLTPDMEEEKLSTIFKEWRALVNNEGQTLDDVLLGAIDGERHQGNQFIEIVRGEIAGKKFVKVYLHSMLYCRLAEPDGDDVVNAVCISKLFAKKGGIRKSDYTKITEIPLWRPNPLKESDVWKKNDDGTYSTMLHFKNEVSGVDYYGLPDSISSLRYQVLEGKYAQFNIDNLDNNMILGGMLIFKSAMTPEEAQKNGKNILMSHVGEGKTGRIAFVSSETGVEDVDFKPYSTQKEGSFNETDKRNEEKIIAAHKWDSILAGINRDSSLGNGSSYIRSIWDVKESVLLKPLRKKMLDKVVNPIIKIYAEWTGDKEVLKYKFSFPSAMPFSFMSDIDPENFMQVNEGRTLAGLPEDPSVEGKYLSEMKTKSNVQGNATTKKGANNN